VPIVLTHGTATGYIAGKALLQNNDVQVWLPWDSVFAVKRFLKFFQPRMGLILETELWPELIYQCHYQQIPLCLVNGRLSEKTLKRTLQWGGSLMQTTYQQLFLVLPQTQQDASRYLQLQANTGPVLGNLKFDAEINTEQQAIGKNWRTIFTRPVLMLASSREGEEALFLDALKAHPLQSQLLNEFQILIVPRHPQRFNEVAELISQAGFQLARRSQWANSMPPTLSANINANNNEDATIVLGDSIGEMPIYYSASQCVLMGGSFLPLGGQNLIEACLYGCPVIMGPSMFNFAQASLAAISAGSGQTVQNLSEGLTLAHTWLQDQQLSRLQALATGFSQQHAGASLASAQVLEKIYLESFNKRAASIAK
jgi:3-deoxy-D-manno-octulosonic-acid transferase